jgi:excinuclease ABC subunit B
MDRAMKETERRRGIQLQYNTTHGITPKTIKKKIHDITESMRTEHAKTVASLVSFDREQFQKNPSKVIREKERQMNAAVKILDFETAAILRDEIRALQEELKTE